ncbi:hypothetical protein [Athalassotoga saccharophila]|uniref:hypothetical protein n=1 Tax=Athalassotoga saccharophila TaxID=1441386 RepID=UPI00137B2209|nr:hypothetical protein [Athalassotoga saccharophila]BBJ27394.1 hypothetical protein ATHSA_0262 [Athalassotoga saccharophila]
MNKGKTVMAILIKNRKETTDQVQKILTGWGCIIKTRLGIHDGVLDNCSDEGLLILELVGTDEQNAELNRKLNLIKGVKSQFMKLELD